jgi:MGT family glycosyltransferase
MDLTGSTPPFLFDWPYDPAPEGRSRNMEGLRVSKEIAGPVRTVATSYVEIVGMQIDWTDPLATASKLAIIAQTPREFDFPVFPWPPQFHYAGPFHDSDGRQPVSFSWDKLTEAPLIYASLGTLLNIDWVYRTILKAVGRLEDVQLVLSVGSRVNPDHLGPLPSNAIVVPAAPQVELLKRAELCITHAGLNTALESLANGVPMIAIPIGFDQPGVASRIAYHGVGELLSLEQTTEEGLYNLLQRIRGNPAYKAKAQEFQRIIAETHGLEMAADVLEESLGKALAAAGVKPDEMLA